MSLFPPANFTYFPITRTASWGFEILALCIYVFGLVGALSRLKGQARRTVASLKSELDNVELESWKISFFGTLPWSVDILVLGTSSSGKKELRLRTYRLWVGGRVWSCCLPCGACAGSSLSQSYDSHIDNADTFTVNYNRFWPIPGVVWLSAFLQGLIWGLAIHFIPCIWWTCDWGPYDGAGIRGGIWFGVWIFSMFTPLFPFNRPAQLCVAKGAKAVGDKGDCMFNVAVKVRQSSIEGIRPGMKSSSALAYQISGWMLERKNSSAV